jgi:dienelactone hydrolase
MTARDWARFGEFMRLGGVWEGKQLIRDDLLAECQQGTKQNPAYGLTWWLRKPVPEAIVQRVPILQRDMGDIVKSDWLPDDLFMAAGAGKQRLYVISSQQLVIVRQGSLSASRSFSDAEFLARLLRSAEASETPVEKAASATRPVAPAAGMGGVLPPLSSASPTPAPATFAPASSDESESLWRDAIDPEIHQGESRMVWQDSRGAILLEALDPKTGLADGNKSRVQLDAGAANLRQTFNGPEFGMDARGWAVFYTKGSGDDLQLWRARLVDGKPHAEPLFRDGRHRQSALASKNTTAESTRLIYIKGDVKDGVFHWADLAAPECETRIVRTLGVDSPRWIDDTLTFVFAEAEGPDKGQIKIHDTMTGRTTVISADAGVKSFAYGWKAPEFGGEILVMSLVDHAAVGIWRQTVQDKWERIQTITPPAGSRHSVIGSPEPFVCEGRSYISAVIKSEGGTMRFRDSEVWLFGLTTGDTTLCAVRADAGGIERTRSDAEILAVGGTIHVYYNIFAADTGYRIGHTMFTPGVPRNYADEIEKTPLKIATVPELVLHDAKRNKDLRMRINCPQEGGPFPVILFSHGAWGSKDGHVMLTELWAAHGYVTIQPDHADSRALGVKVGDPSVFRGWQERPADISFILDSLAEIEAKVPALKGKMDAKRIGMSGHSYGANTAQLVGGAKAYFGSQERNYEDTRVTAVALLSGQGPGEMLTGKSWAGFTKPFLVMTGSADGPARTGQPAVWRKQPYELSPPGDKYLVWIEGMDHGFGGVSGLKDGLVKFKTNPDHVLYTKMATLAFWDACLKDNEQAVEYLRSGQLSEFSKGTVEINYK